MKVQQYVRRFGLFLALAVFDTSVEAAQFVSIANSPIVTEGARSVSTSWVDYNDDGLLDLFVTTQSGPNLLFRNSGNNGFASVSTANLNGDPFAQSGVWADVENDGDIDLFLSIDATSPNALFLNSGSNSFTRMTGGSIVSNRANSVGAAWADYDNDGLVDLFVANGGFGAGTSQVPNKLYRNLGGGAFEEIISGPSSNLQSTISASWGDYDNDGFIDLFVANAGEHPNGLYRNNGSGGLTLTTGGTVSGDRAGSFAGAWGDYNNDGYLDLFVANFGASTNFLYRNNQDGTFTKIQDGPIPFEGGSCNSAAWGDYDNDGFLDLYVTRAGNNLLYRNRGDGAFERIYSEPLVQSGAYSIGCAWGDYNEDGFLDLVVATWADGKNQLFVNGGNSNNWIKVRCVGVRSNRSAIGAKVRARSNLSGVVRQQLRQVSGGDSYGSQNDLTTHFGLGTATTVNELSVEWPSGEVQVLTNITANQEITVLESGHSLVLDPAGGEFTNSVSIGISGKRISESEIRFTLDHSDPHPASSLYTGPIVLGSSAVLKVAEFLNNRPVSLITTGIYTRVYTSADGIPDFWRIEYFGTAFRTDPRVAANADPDLDGSPNIAEYFAGTSPLDASSILELGIRMIPSLSWNTVSNRFYRLIRKDSAASSPIPITPFIRGTGEVSSFLDVDAPSMHSIYLIEATPELPQN